MENRDQEGGGLRKIIREKGGGESGTRLPGKKDEPRKDAEGTKGVCGGEKSGALKLE